MRTIANVALSFLLVITLLSSVCLGCVPISSGGCCNPAGHCEKVRTVCDTHPVVLPFRECIGRPAGGHRSHFNFRRAPRAFCQRGIAAAGVGRSLAP
jgi:hypothetical protein